MLRLDLKTRIQRTLDRSRQKVSGRLISRQLSYIVDSILIGLFQQKALELGIQDRICLIPVGGYGRMELSPHSDIDILYLHDYLDEGQLSEVISKVNTFLYDNGKQVGHSVRTIPECRDSLNNLHTFHSYLDARFLAGSEKLYSDFKHQFLDKLPKDTIHHFNTWKLKTLSERILESREPLLLAEPNIKTDPFGLRDIQFIYWIEKTNQTQRIREIHGVFDYFVGENIQDVVQSYDYLLRTRITLHEISDRKNDRLDLSLQPLVAEKMGYGSSNSLDSIDRFMTDLYKHQKDVYFFMGIYLDRTRLHNVPTLNQSDVQYQGMHFQRRDNVLYPSPHNKLFSNPDSLYEDILHVFSFCQKENLEPSKILIEEIRFASHFLEDDFKNNKPTLDLFLEILKEGKRIGKLLTLMHECNILGKLLPEFGACTNFPLFSYHHQYPVDEHTLLILRQLDLLESGEYDDSHLLEVYRTIPRMDILALAILIHDAGKVKEGDHCQYGAELSSAVSARLGYTEEEAELFQFLVEHHIDMSEISTKRDIYDPLLIRRFARVLENKTRLNYLYVLTIIDTQSVGPGVLTNWKKEILLNLYLSVNRLFDSEHLGIEHMESKSQALLDYLSIKEGLESDLSRKILEFAKTMKPDNYIHTNTPRRIFSHYKSLAISKKEKVHFTMEWEKEPSFVDITVTCKYRKDSALLLSGVVSSMGLNLVGLRVFQTKDSELILLSQITDSLGSGQIQSEILERMQTTLEDLFLDKTAIDDIMLQPIGWRSFNTIPKGMVEELVVFTNDQSDEHTILEVRLPDSLGLLYRVLREILASGLLVHFVRITTSADYAHDSFYVQTETGEKVTNLKIQNQLRNQILKIAQSEINDQPQEIYF